MNTETFSKSLRASERIIIRRALRYRLSDLKQKALGTMLADEVDSLSSEYKVLQDLYHDLGCGR